MTQHLAPADLAASTLAEVAESTQRLLHTVSELAPEAVPEPSGLPGWSRGHVLAHLARNADSLVNLLESARTGRDIPQYASESAREEGIDNGAPRPLDEQLADITASAERLAATAAALTPEQWSVQLKHRFGYTFPAYELPAKRLVELEYHHVDLRAGYTPAHWPADFARAQFDRLTADLATDELPTVVLVCDDVEHRAVIGAGPAALLVEGPIRALTAWLSGRSDGDGLQVRENDGPLLDHTALPALPSLG